LYKNLPLYQNKFFKEPADFDREQFYVAKIIVAYLALTVA
jgi:hypothetical protein